MSEARDRLSRQDDDDVVVSAYSRRRVSRSGDRSAGRGSSVIFVLEDVIETVTPFRWRGAGMMGTRGRMGLDLGSGVRTPRVGRIAPIAGRENSSPAAVGSDLPNWYPRRPLNDITPVIRAIERRRRKRVEDLHMESPSVSAQLEHDIYAITPRSTISTRRCPSTSIGKVPKILLDNIVNQNDEDSACLTPQMKLLNNIDKVEKLVMKELRKITKTPLAKREERTKRVRTLMSMR